eukprot:m.48557 g.48557  ORF g.48557 m.48557 type:complete len:445 (-) comp13296_c0_seq1:60-1394(-)
METIIMSLYHHLETIPVQSFRRQSKQPTAICPGRIHRVIQPPVGFIMATQKQPSPFNNRLSRNPGVKTSQPNLSLPRHATSSSNSYNVVARKRDGRFGLAVKSYGQGPSLVHCLQLLSDAKLHLVCGSHTPRHNDILLTVNGHDVSVASHDEVIRLLKRSEDVLHLELRSNPAEGLANSRDPSQHSLLPDAMAPTLASQPSKPSFSRLSIPGTVLHSQLITSVSAGGNAIFVLRGDFAEEHCSTIQIELDQLGVLRTSSSVFKNRLREHAFHLLRPVDHPVYLLALSRCVSFLNGHGWQLVQEQTPSTQHGIQLLRVVGEEHGAVPQSWFGVQVRENEIVLVDPPTEAVNTLTSIMQKVVDEWSTKLKTDQVAITHRSHWPTIEIYDLSQLLDTARTFQPTLLQHIHGRVRRVLVQHGWTVTKVLVESAAKPVELFCRLASQQP